MWDTSKGTRVLSGHEAAMVREAVSWMVDTIHDESHGHDDLSETGVDLFDRLPWTQRLAVLDEVTTALLLPSAKINRHSSIHDAAVGAIYRCIDLYVEMEIDHRESLHWRTLVRNAYRSFFKAEPNDAGLLPRTLGDDCKDRWSFAIELLLDCILHDRDFAAADTFLDAAPDKASYVRQFLGVNESYFADVSSDIRDTDAESVFQHIKQLTATER